VDCKIFAGVRKQFSKPVRELVFIWWEHPRDPKVGTPRGPYHQNTNTSTAAFGFNKENMKSGKIRSLFPTFLIQQTKTSTAASRADFIIRGSKFKRHSLQSSIPK
jgi:hypothetical protein